MNLGVRVRASVRVENLDTAKGAGIRKARIRRPIEYDCNARGSSPGKVRQSNKQIPAGLWLIAVPSDRLTHYIVAIDDVCHARLLREAAELHIHSRPTLD